MFGRNVRGESAASAHFEQMAEQAEAGDIGHGMHSGETRQLHAWQIQLRGRLDHGAIARVIQQTFLEGRGKYADAERLAEDQYDRRCARRCCASRF